MLEVKIPEGMAPVRCAECKRLLYLPQLKEGSCECGQRKMKITNYLGFIEWFKIKCLGYKPIFVGDSKLTPEIERSQMVKM